MMMPASSKKELILNIDTNYNHVFAVKTLVDSLVTKGHKVYIEFGSPIPEIHLGEYVDFWYWEDNSVERRVMVFQEWNIEITSPKLDTLLQKVGWSRSTLSDIRQALQKANCISVQSGEPAEIGYARSGMGKYSYTLFSKDATPEQKEEYNNQCEYIFYKNNIILQYGGGAAGPQCFPDRDE